MQPGNCTFLGQAKVKVKNFALRLRCNIHVINTRQPQTRLGIIV